MVDLKKLKDRPTKKVLVSLDLERYNNFKKILVADDVRFSSFLNEIIEMSLESYEKNEPLTLEWVDNPKIDNKDKLQEDNKRVDNNQES